MYGSRLLVVAPEAELRVSLARRLRPAGYLFETACTGGEAIASLGRARADLIIVDVEIPDVYELDRSWPVFADRPPVLCVTPCESLGSLVGELGDRVEDYVTKPCRVAELLARVQVLLRGRSVLRHGDLRLDERTCRVWRGDRPIEVTASEFRLLRRLLLNAGQVLSKEQLGTSDYGLNAVERQISRLRRKIDATGPALIHTRRGLGYWLGEGEAG
ncbi:response regulator transcription factor [Actinoplanes bogorensis]|uniref:Response regulator transcription factor n=1 Tax=Paractinoplanes bogorensis TaxID=1610840 RepID=A0ABS5YXB7_9ACTN|nr:response regulator transcription factor [Actinoplanes bogorensis]MBU2668090.1 response regulator transcription factor [Actinoplanes bogorensis]